MLNLGTLHLLLRDYSIPVFEISGSKKYVHQTKNLEIRKHICNNITDSVHFRERGMIPIDFDIAYDLVKKMASEKADLIFKGVLRKYKEESSSMTYTHPTKIVRVDVPEEMYEVVFECLTIDATTMDQLNLSYISEVYNANEEPNSSFIAARFVFDAFRAKDTDFTDSGTVRLLAEEPATALFEPKHNIEKLYLQMRSYYRSSEFYYFNFLILRVITQSFRL